MKKQYLHSGECSHQVSTNSGFGARFNWLAGCCCSNITCPRVFSAFSDILPSINTEGWEFCKGRRNLSEGEQGYRMRCGGSTSALASLQCGPVRFRSPYHIWTDLVLAPRVFLRVLRFEKTPTFPNSICQSVEMPLENSNVFVLFKKKNITAIILCSKALETIVNAGWVLLYLGCQRLFSSGDDCSAKADARETYIV